MARGEITALGLSAGSFATQVRDLRICEQYWVSLLWCLLCAGSEREGATEEVRQMHSECGVCRPMGRPRPGAPYFQVQWFWRLLPWLPWPWLAARRSRPVRSAWSCRTGTNSSRSPLGTMLRVLLLRLLLPASVATAAAAAAAAALATRLFSFNTCFSAPARWLLCLFCSFVFSSDDRKSMEARNRLWQLAMRVCVQCRRSASPSA